MFPSRYTHLEEARRRFGDRIDRLGPFLLQTDPLADEVVAVMDELPRRGQDLLDQALRYGIETVPRAPEAFRKLFAALDRVPFWVNWKTLDRGGATFLRTGFFGGTVLACESLVLGYCSPAGNKPLMFTGRLKDYAARRLTETSRFVLEVCRPGGLRRFSPGFAITVKVRLMHAQVRRMLLRSGRWQTSLWGEPINQLDMSGTLLLFSTVALDGLRKFGFTITPEESESLIQLWRYAGYLLGVDPELLAATERESIELLEMIHATSADPDEDSRALVRALMEVPLTEARKKAPHNIEKAKKFVAFSYGISRGLIGEEFAQKLGYPKTAWRFSLPALRALVYQTEFFRQRLPLGSNLASLVGTRYWDWIVEMGSEGIPIDFALPRRLSAHA